ncbi:MAG: TetR/AcrR family transcriptional regulator [Leptospiraceae bacterium]|nr:TetR/AcrR family transcriptional regulator [Leptospiraceae bacterium]
MKKNAMEEEGGQGRPPLTELELQQGREQILAVARSLFHRHGYDAVSIRRIMRETSRSPMMFYRYFPSKRAVIRYLWADILDAFYTYCEEGAARMSTPRFGLEMYLRRSIQYWLDHPSDFKVLYLNPDALESESNETEPEYFADQPGAYDRTEYLANLVRETAAAERLEIMDIELAVQQLIVQILGLSFSIIMIPELPWRDAGTHIDETIRSMFVTLGLPYPTSDHQ